MSNTSGTGKNEGFRDGGVALKKLDMHGYRRSHCWRVEETDESLFFIDVALPGPDSKAIGNLFETTDQCHQRVREALDLGSEVKDKERQRRINTWLYAPDLLAEADFAEAKEQNVFYGTVNPAGLHFITRGLAWDDPIVFQCVLHEVVHFWWADQVGEAPSLLNEGVAVYFEHVLGIDFEKGHGILKNFWHEYSGRTKPGFLRRLCSNDVFWTEKDAGEPVYEIGGQLVSFLLDTYGLQSVKHVFLGSHYDDPDLPQNIESVVGASLEYLEVKITVSS